MRKLVKLSLIISFVSFANGLFAQSDSLLTELPEDNKEAYVKSEKQVIYLINWLEKAPVDQDVDNRKTQVALLLAWIANSPTVTVELNGYVLDFTKKNPELLVTFMGGWTKYCLENSYSDDKIKGNLAGLQSVITFYKNGNGLQKDKELDKLVDIDSKGELESWVKKQLAKK